MEAIEHHLEFLTKQLISEDVLKSVESTDLSSSIGCALQNTLSLSTVLARVAGVSENYKELKKGHDLISFTVEMVQNLLKLVRREGEREGGRGREGGREGEKERGRERGREGGEMKEGAKTRGNEGGRRREGGREGGRNSGQRMGWR